MSGRAFKMLEAIFNRNVKITFDLPYPTHRNLLPLVSGVTPLRELLSCRYLRFITRLRTSTKDVLRMLINPTEEDTTKVIGRNLRNIMLASNKATVKDLIPSDEKYCHPEQWRLEIIKDAGEIMAGEMDPPEGFAI